MQNEVISMSFTIKDLRNTVVFPDTPHRFSSLTQTSDGVELRRDFLGENPLHYYADIQRGELIVANNIADIQEYLGQDGGSFAWDRVRAVHNNTVVRINAAAFSSAEAQEDELSPALQERLRPIDDRLESAAHQVRTLLDASLERRCATIPEFPVGLLLSGGLDSMSIGYLLSRTDREVIAFTLKVTDTNPDIVRARQLAQHFRMPLVEVQLTMVGDLLTVSTETYDSQRRKVDARTITPQLPLDTLVTEALRIGNSPKRDNALCSMVMYAIAPALRAQGITTAYCGEGPNEMLNDYGFLPSDSGYPTADRGDIAFREALTFGSKKGDRQLGRGGLAKHGASRMFKIFGHYGIRLEAPYYDAEIARIMTALPHIAPHDEIKGQFVECMLADPQLTPYIRGVAKEKFQDGSGFTKLMGRYTQEVLIARFEELYGIRKQTYLRYAR